MQCNEPASATLESWTMVTAGWSHSCGITVQGDLRCWGGGGIGYASVNIPTLHNDTWATVTAHRVATCGVTVRGNAHCWSYWTKPLPYNVPSGVVWKQMEASRDYACGITVNGEVICFTDDADFDRNRAITMVPHTGDARWTSLCVNKYHACGTTEDGQAHCWGSNSFGRATVPELEGSKWVSVACGTRHSCGLTNFGVIECWGDFTGELGDVPVLPESSKWVSVAAGEEHTCGLTSSGFVHCWGNSGNGRTAPAVAGGVPWVSVSVGYNHGCAKSQLGSIHCWGIEDPNIVDVVEPNVLHWADFSSGNQATCAIDSVGALQCWGSGPVEGSPTTSTAWRVVSVGRFHSCAIATNGTLHCWGQRPHANIPFLNPESLRWVEVSVGGAHSCGQLTNGTWLCWGENSNGQCSIPATASSWASMRAGWAHTCGLTLDGALLCWGANAKEQLNTPALGAGEHWISFDAKFMTSCGITNTHKLFCWGAVGDANVDVIQRGQTQWATVACGFDFSCAITQSGTMHCWGQNPTPPPFSGLLMDYRYLHLTWLQPNDYGICGNQYMSNTPICIGFSGAYPYIPKPEDLLFVANTGVGVVQGLGIGAPLVWNSFITGLPSTFDNSFGSGVIWSISLDNIACGYGMEGFEVNALMCFDLVSLETRTPIFRFPDLSQGVRYLHITPTGTCVQTPGHALLCIDDLASAPSVLTRNNSVHSAAVQPGMGCALMLNQSVVCWGDAVPADAQQLLIPTASRFTSIAIARELVCAITAQFTVACWGDAARKVEANLLFAGSGWLDVALHNSSMCGSHLNGRLVCSGSAVMAGTSWLDPSHSVPMSVVGLSADATVVGCPSVERCIVSSTIGLPPPQALVLLGNLQLTEPLRFPFRYLGPRSKSRYLKQQAVIKCQTGDNACIAPMPSIQALTVQELVFEGTAAAFLDVSGRTEVALRRVSCQAHPLCTPLGVFIADGVAVTIDGFEWSTTPAAQCSELEGQGPFNPSPSPHVPSASSGAMVIRDVASLYIVSSTWKNYQGVAVSSRALSVMYSSKLSPLAFSMSESLFEGCSSVSDGGAVMVSDRSGSPSSFFAPVLQRVRFIGNAAPLGRGGGLYWHRLASQLPYSDLCFSCSEGMIVPLQLLDVTFDHNLAREGGGFALYGVNAYAAGTWLNRNTAALRGGAVHLLYSSIELTSSMIEENSLNNTGYGSSHAQASRGGGAIYAESCDRAGLSFSSSAVARNTVFSEPSDPSASARAQGGAVYARSCRMSSRNASFVGNVVPGLGGAVFIEGSSKAIFDVTAFSDNVAKYGGGALAARESVMYLYNSTCTGNTAVTPGVHAPLTAFDGNGRGGCLVTLPGEFVLEMADTVISHNNAQFGGGYFIDCGTVLTAQRVSFVDNVGTASGENAFSACPAEWLEEGIRAAWQMLLPQATIGTNAVRLNVSFAVQGLLNEETVEYSIAEVELLDAHEALVEDDFFTQCSLHVSSDGKRSPVLTSASVFIAEGGVISITPFSVTAFDASQVALAVQCGMLSLVHTFPVLALQTSWLVPPPGEFVPSSATALLPLLPPPVVAIVVPKENLLAGVQVSCSVTRSIDGSDYFPLLSPPPDDYRNSAAEPAAVALPGLYFDVPYGSTCELRVKCQRGTEVLPLLVWSLHMKPFSLSWSIPPPTVIVSGAPLTLAVAASDPTSPAAIDGHTICTATVSQPAGAGPVDTEYPFVRGASAAMQHGVANWTSLIITGKLGTNITLLITCATGTTALPQQLQLRTSIATCAIGTQPDAKAVACIPCRGNTYSDGHLQPCSQCPPQGAQCQHGVLQLLPQYYPASVAYRLRAGGNVLVWDESVVLYPCWNEEACEPPNRNASHACSLGYTGPLCGVCRGDVNYVASGTSCVPCWPPWLNWLVVLALLFIVAAALVYVAVFWQSSAVASSRRILLRMTLSFLQMLSSIGTFHARATDTFQRLLGIADTVGGSVFSLSPLQCVFRISFYTRFALSMGLPVIVGIAVVIIGVLGLVLRHWFMLHRRSRTRRVLKLSNSNSSSLDNRSGGSSGGSGHSLKAALRYYFRHKEFIGPVLFVVFLFYNSLASVGSSMFRCRDEVIDGRRYLAADLQVECYTAAHTSWMVISALLLLVFNVLFPTLLLVYLRRHAAKLHSPAMLARVGFLYQGYSTHRHMYGWESVVLFRKLAVLICAAVLSDPWYQAMSAIAVVMVFLVLQVHYKPYDRALFNRLEVLVLSSLAATQVICLFYLRSNALSGGQGDVEGETLVTIVLIALNAAVLVILLACGLWEWKSAKTSQHKEGKQRGGAASLSQHGGPRGHWLNPLSVGQPGSDNKQRPPAVDAFTPPATTTVVGNGVLLPASSSAVVVSSPWAATPRRLSDVRSRLGLLKH